MTPTIQIRGDPYAEFAPGRIIFIENAVMVAVKSRQAAKIGLRPGQILRKRNLGCAGDFTGTGGVIGQHAFTGRDPRYLVFPSVAVDREVDIRVVDVREAETFLVQVDGNRLLPAPAARRCGWRVRTVMGRIDYLSNTQPVLIRHLHFEAVGTGWVAFIIGKAGLIRCLPTGVLKVACRIDGCSTKLRLTDDFIGERGIRCYRIAGIARHDCTAARIIVGDRCIVLCNNGWAVTRRRASRGIGGVNIGSMTDKATLSAVAGVDIRVVPVNRPCIVNDADHGRRLIDMRHGKQNRCRGGLSIGCQYGVIKTGTIAEKVGFRLEMHVSIGIDEGTAVLGVKHPGEPQVFTRETAEGIVRQQAGRIHDQLGVFNTGYMAFVGLNLRQVIDARDEQRGLPGTALNQNALGYDADFIARRAGGQIGRGHLARHAVFHESPHRVVERGDAVLGERGHLSGIDYAVAVLVLPDPHLVEHGIGGVDNAVPVGIHPGQARQSAAIQPHR